uniref:Uncharacterized protein n=1 Tax=Opuntia streptacantha TaxID=393608 RepID=A0A7C9AVX5_OPUST
MPRWVTNMRSEKERPSLSRATIQHCHLSACSQLPHLLCQPMYLSIQALLSSQIRSRPLWTSYYRTLNRIAKVFKENTNYGQHSTSRWRTKHGNQDADNKRVGDR